MPNKRDVELLLKATDLSSKTFQQVSQAVDDLKAKLTQQEAAAAKGNVTTRELATTMRQLGDAQQALARQAAVVEMYAKLSQQLDTASGKATTLRDAYNALTATTEAAGGATGRQQTQLDNLAKRLQAADSKAAGLSQTLGRYGELIERMGLDTAALATADEQITVALQDSSAARLKAQAVLDNYDAALRSHRAELAAQKDAEAAAAAAWKTHLAEEAEALKVTEAAEREFAAVDAFKQKAADAQKLNESRQYIAFWTQALNDADAAQSRDVAQREADTKAIAEQTAALKANVEAATKGIAFFGRRNPNAPTAAPAPTAPKQGGEPANGPLGLTASEFTNLGYQVNDIVTQIASGQHLTMILAQQGGQVLQVFQRQIGNFISILPRLVAAGAVIAAVVAVFVRAANTAASLRDFNAQLSLSADGSKYSATQIVALQRQLQTLGADFDDAGTALKTFISAGVQQDKLAEFGQTALNLSRVLGTSLPDAAKTLTTALQGGYKSIADFDNQMDILTIAQRNQIKAMFDAGNATGAQAEFLDILNAKAKTAAATLDGPFTQAWRDTKAAVYDLLDLLANGSLSRLASASIEGLAAALKTVANGVRAVVDILPGGGGRDNDATALRDDRNNASQARQGLIDRMTLAQISGNSPAIIAKLQQQIAVADAKIAQMDAQLAKIGSPVLPPKGAGPQQFGPNLPDAATTQSLKLGNDYIRNLQDQAKNEKLAGDAARVHAKGLEAVRAAEDAGVKNSGQLDDVRKLAEAAAQREINNEHTEQSISLQSELNSLLSSAGKAQQSPAAAAQAVVDQYKIIYDKIAQFQKVGGSSVNGVPLSQFTAQVKQAEQYLIQQAEIKAYEQQINDLVAARDTKLKDITDSIKDGTMSGAEGLRQAQDYNAKFLPQLQQTAKAALDFATALEKTNPSPQLESFITKTQRTLTQSTGTGASSSIGKFGAITDPAAQLEKINDLMQTRNTLAKSFQDLADKGIISQSSANTDIKKVYDDQAAGITAAADALQKYIDEFGSGLPTEQLDLLKAKLAEIRSQVQYADPEWTKLEKTIGQSFVQEAGTAIDTVADSIGKVVAGTEKWGDALKDVGVAAAQFFASFLKDIAEAIIKQTLLNAVQSAFPGLSSFLGLGAAGATSLTAGASSIGSGLTPLAGLAHGGGAVTDMGVGNTSRPVNPAWFAGAPRYHNGTVVGLSADEQAAVLQKGEEVLSKDNPRNALNAAKKAGQMGAAPQNIRSVLVLDDSLIPQAMQAAPGEQVVMSHIRKNIPTIRQLVNGGKKS